MSDLMRRSTYDKPVPEPHFIPGYTGHCPDLPDHIGMAYPWVTYAVLAEKPHYGYRLSPIRAPKRKHAFEVSGLKRTLTEEDADDKIIKERRDAQNHPLLGADIAIGYVGHVPKEREVIGKTHEKVYRKCIADFERQQRVDRGSAVGCKCCCHCCSCKRK